MSCVWNVECVTNKDFTYDEMQEIICSKIANVLIHDEKGNCTLVNIK